MREFDVVVIGAGVAGEVAAGRLGEHGVSVAIVEDRLVGGDCSYFACMPSKALLRPVELARRGRARARPRGRADRRRRGAAAARRRHPRPRRQGAAAVARAARRHARPRARPHRRREAGRRRRRGVARRATPSSSRRARRRSSPTSPACDAAAVDEHGGDDGPAVPPRLAILGGGVVGVEMAQAWAALGSHVTLIHRGERLIEREEPFASEQVLEALAETGRGRAARTLGACACRAPEHVALELDDGSDARGGRASRRVRAHTGHRGHRPRDARHRDGSRDPGRRRPPRSRPRLAVRRRRRERPRAADAHGQVPGPARRRRDPRPGGAAEVRRGSVAARDLHRPAGRSCRAHAGQGAQAAASRVRHVDVETSGNAGGSFVGRGAPGTLGSSSTRTGGSSSVRRSRARRSPKPSRRDDRGRGRGAPRRPLARRAVVPDAQRAVAEAPRGIRPLGRLHDPARHGTLTAGGWWRTSGRRDELGDRRPDRTGLRTRSS